MIKYIMLYILVFMTGYFFRIFLVKLVKQICNNSKKNKLNKFKEKMKELEIK